MQAVLYFIGQVILSNLDILLVKHFFPAAGSGNLRGRGSGRARGLHVVVVGGEQHVSGVGQSHASPGRALGAVHRIVLVGTVTSAFIAAVALTPQAAMDHAAGKSRSCWVQHRSPRC
jgi:hypothetical protein